MLKNIFSQPIDSNFSWNELLLLVSLFWKHTIKTVKPNIIVIVIKESASPSIWLSLLNTERERKSIGTSCLEEYEKKTKFAPKD